MPTPDAAPDAPDEFAGATEPARWLLGLAAEPGGVALTQTGAITRAVVRDGHDRYGERLSPGMHAFSPPMREADVPWLEALHIGLKRLRLLRRRGKALLTTAAGRDALDDPHGLLTQLLGDFTSEPDAFSATIAGYVLAHLERHTSITLDAIHRAAVDELLTGGWRFGQSAEPPEQALSALVQELRAASEGYGILLPVTEPGRTSAEYSRPLAFQLTAGARRILGEAQASSAAAHEPLDPASAEASAIYSFDLALESVRAERVKGVTATAALLGAQTLDTLHHVIVDAFGWFDEHLYSFWLDGKYWGDQASEYTRVSDDDFIDIDDAQDAARAPLAQLGLATDSRIAYVFDFGDEFRVKITVRSIDVPADGAEQTTLGVLTRSGTPPAQYEAG